MHPQNWSGIFSLVAGLEEDAAPPTHQLPLLITHYTEAVSQLEAIITGGEDSGQYQGTVVVPTASLLHDLGSLHLHSNNRKWVIKLSLIKFMEYRTLKVFIKNLQ